jgi:hypothetical protein
MTKPRHDQQSLPPAERLVLVLIAVVIICMFVPVVRLAQIAEEDTAPQPASIPISRLTEASASDQGQQAVETAATARLSPPLFAETPSFGEPARGKGPSATAP